MVRGGGDLATGTIWMLQKAGFSVLVLESERPSAIRRTVAFSEAVYEGRSAVEGVECRLAHSFDEARGLLSRKKLTLLVDPGADAAAEFHPSVLVDAILAKKNIGTTRDMAPLVIALGPGFTAGRDCDIVVETMRGHNLGRIFETGSALPNTGVPGPIAGHAADRVLHAEWAGVLENRASIGDIVKQGQTIAVIRSGDGREHPVRAAFTGLLRGLIRSGYPVTPGFKIADIDPRREERRNCFTISDKARCIGGSVLCAILMKRGQP